jgi:hypothetical protein
MIFTFLDSVFMLGRELHFNLCNIKTFIFATAVANIIWVTYSVNDKKKIPDILASLAHGKHLVIFNHL